MNSKKAFPPPSWAPPALSILLVALICAGCGGNSSNNSPGSGGTAPPANKNEWMWVSGSNDANSSSSLNGVYGTQGVAAATNVPPGRLHAVSWSDNNGNLWLFGGGGFDPLGTHGALNDLWQFNLSSKEWTWVGGSSTAPVNQRGVYGTEGVAAAANVPGGRGESARWTDASGNLWLFGGQGYDANGAGGSLNDLWEFNPSTKQWAWISGSSTINGQGVYGNLGVAAAANVPCARSNAVSWTDRNGNLWLFGGQKFDSSGSLNDLWEFNTGTKEWTWVSGSTTVNAKGVYGTEGTAATTNVPGSRVNAVSWTDSSGSLWLFGGLGNDSTGSEYDLNDLWEFNPSSKEWTWVSGSSTGAGSICQAGVYGAEGTAASGNVPGGRNDAVSWTDPSGNFRLFGGLGCDSSGTAGSLNDLWEFNPSAKTWTWQSGSNSVGPPKGGTGGQSGVYGTLGKSAATNTPGGRSGAVSWTDSSGNLWLFGGVGLDSTGQSGYLNDLWSYTP